MGDETRLRVFFHPQRGAAASADPIPPTRLRYRGGPDVGWVALNAFVTWNQDGSFTRHGRLPPGFLWGAPERQRYGLGGPLVAFGPLERDCRDCQRPFVFTAEEQQDWYEVRGFFIDVTAVRCRACRRKRHALEYARRGWAMALDEVKRDASVECARRAVKAGLLVVERGGRVAWQTLFRLAARAGPEAQAQVRALRR